ncbi:WD40/YVTN/BNR-like repeat-containing protein [Oceaniglobus roseus]|uniref:WD40/YVTN/BNR-like repeat-containing protein n=1 Tax=Oceaniglobus roseus TaxID=1737570 RepID=UPI000C7ED5CC|nr:sialidase family protein [Kandeliimicrobium roseum]
MAGITILIGTTKGLFLARGDEARDGWALSGPFCGGWPVNHVAGDPETGRLWAAGGNEWFGAGVWRSEDGAEWTLAKLANGQADAWLAANPEMAAHLGMEPAGPAPFSGAVDALWSLKWADGTLHAGAKPAALFASRDGGATWHRVQGLTDHPSSGSWEPGAAGLTLHTIVTDPADPAKMWVGISAAGVFATEDGGQSWERRNRRSNAEAVETATGACGHEVGHCVHNMVRASGAGDLLYQQNHHGTFRSRDGGRSWDDIGGGLPSTFGFPIAVHPTDPDRIWVVPLNGDTQGRFPVEARAAVWTSGDGGATWEAQRQGLPQENCFFTVLRQAMATDRGAPAGVYFGTNSGSVFATRDEGESWHEIIRHLPTVLCVETMTR